MVYKVNVTHKYNLYEGLINTIKYRALQDKKSEITIHYTHLKSITQVRSREEIILVNDYIIVKYYFIAKKTMAESKTGGI